MNFWPGLKIPKRTKSNPTAATAAHPQDKPRIELVEKTESNFYLDELVDSILGGLDYFQSIGRRDQEDIGIRVKHRSLSNFGVGVENPVDTAASSLHEIQL